jgi:hypothetical protein
VGIRSRVNVVGKYRGGPRFFTICTHRSAGNLRLQIHGVVEHYWPGQPGMKRRLAVVPILAEMFRLSLITVRCIFRRSFFRNYFSSISLVPPSSVYSMMWKIRFGSHEIYLRYRLRPVTLGPHRNPTPSLADEIPCFQTGFLSLQFSLFPSLSIFHHSSL